MAREEEGMGEGEGRVKAGGVGGRKEDDVTKFVDREAGIACLYIIIK